MSLAGGEVLPILQPHHAEIMRSGDGRYAPVGWRIHCAGCKSWWAGALGDYKLTVAVADEHDRTGVWPA